MSKHQIKRLFFDIETSPNIGIFWRAGFKQTIFPESILTERKIICICYKWQGEKKVHSLTWDARQNDKKMLIEFVKVANEAEELVGHNGDRYDLAFIRTRCLFHKIAMFPAYVTIDTLKYARSKFMFNSNKLDYIGQFLGEGKKINTGGIQLWKDIVLKRCASSLRKMVKYCIQDVNLLERVFLRLNNHFLPKINRAIKHGGTRQDCPECGSDKTVVVNTRYTAAGMKRVQRQCNGCHKYFTASGKNAA